MIIDVVKGTTDLEVGYFCTHYTYSLSRALTISSTLSLIKVLFWNQPAHTLFKFQENQVAPVIIFNDIGVIKIMKNTNINILVAIKGLLSRVHVIRTYQPRPASQPARAHGRSGPPCISAIKYPVVDIMIFQLSSYNILIAISRSFGPRISHIEVIRKL